MLRVELSHSTSHVCVLAGKYCLPLCMSTCLSASFAIIMLALSTLPLHFALHLYATTSVASIAIQGTIYAEQSQMYVGIMSGTVYTEKTWMCVMLCLLSADFATTP